MNIIIYFTSIEKQVLVTITNLFWNYTELVPNVLAYEGTKVVTGFRQTNSRFNGHKADAPSHKHKDYELEIDLNIVATDWRTGNEKRLEVFERRRW